MASIKLQTRDILLLHGLFESRVMTRRHISTLYFDDRTEAAKKRLQKLLAARLIIEREHSPTGSSAILLAKTGYDTLRSTGQLATYQDAGDISFKKRTQVSNLTIRHELAVMDVKAALHRATRSLDRLDIAEFTTWPRLCQFYARRPSGEEAHSSRKRMLIKPDGFIRVHDREEDGGTSEHAFFLEMDRGTETLGTIMSKVQGFLDFYKTGGFAERCGGHRNDYAHFPFRVLLVVLGEARRDNIATALLTSSSPVLTFAWITTMADIQNNPLDAIWVRPIDYRHATARQIQQGASRHGLFDGS